MEAAEAPRTVQERMAAQVRTAPGREVYKQRKTIVEPVFGPIKEARGFRRFLLRGLKKIGGEWRWVCLTHPLLKIWRYGCAPMAAEPGAMTPDVSTRVLVERCWTRCDDIFATNRNHCTNSSSIDTRAG
jgi:hypothetical protein